MSKEYIITLNSKELNLVYECVDAVKSFGHGALYYGDEEHEGLTTLVDRLNLIMSKD